MFGKLTINAIPWDQPIPLIAGAVVGLTLLAVFIWVVIKGHLPYLWHAWITSVDHKRIGVMYVLLGLVMLLRGYIDAVIQPSQTRPRLIAGLEMLADKRADSPRKKHGNIPL